MEVAVLAKWPIRNKLLVGVGLLTVLVATLSTSGFLGVYAYRSLVRSLHNRAAELPLATELAQKVSDLRVSVTAPRRPARPGRRPADSQQQPDLDAGPRPVSRRISTPSNRLSKTIAVNLTQNDQDDLLIGDRSSEQAVVAQMRETIAEMADLAESSAWPLDAKRVERLNSRLDWRKSSPANCPAFCMRRIHDLVGEVRGRYRTLIILDLGDDRSWRWRRSRLLVHLFYRWVFRPLQVLLDGLADRGGGQFQLSDSARQQRRNGRVGPRRSTT